MLAILFYFILSCLGCNTKNLGKFCVGCVTYPWSCVCASVIIQSFSIWCYVIHFFLLWKMKLVQSLCWQQNVLLYWICIQGLGLPPKFHAEVGKQRQSRQEFGGWSCCLGCWLLPGGLNSVLFMLWESMLNLYSAFAIWMNYCNLLSHKIVENK